MLKFSQKVYQKYLQTGRIFLTKKVEGKVKSFYFFMISMVKREGEVWKYRYFYTEILTTILSCLWRFSRVNRVKKVTIPVKITVLHKVIF